MKKQKSNISLAPCGRGRNLSSFAAFRFLVRGITLAAFTLSFVASVAQAKEIEVEALGIGDDYEWAVANALDNAVKQNTEIKITRDAPMEKMAVKAAGIVDVDAGAEIKTVDMKYKGAIKSYDVLSQEEKGGKTHVKIKAKMFVPDDYKSPGLGKKGKYSLSIAPFKGPQAFPCLGRSISSSDISKQLNAGLVAELSKTKQFNIVDRQNLDAYADEALLIEADLAKAEYKNKMKQLTSADYLLVGSVDGFATSSSESYVELTRELYIDSAASMQVSYRLIETATMEIIATGVIDKSIAREGSFGSCSNVAQSLGKKASHQIVADIMEELFPDLKPTPQGKPKGGKGSHRGRGHMAPPPPPVIKLPFDD